MKLEKNGTLFTKDKSRKLDYQKKGSDRYELDIYEFKQKVKEGKVVDKGYVRVNNFKMIMNENTLTNYLKTELYL